MQSEPLLRVDGLTVQYPIGREGFWGQRKRFARAVDNVSFTIAAGETLGLVGESGSGKTSLGRAILRRVPIVSGRIEFDGVDITGLTGSELRGIRRDMQMIFQDPYASLNPRMTVHELIAEPLMVHGLARNLTDAEKRVSELLEQTGLPSEAINRYPHSFSGGQRQRIGIARALAMDPRFIVADEPVSALDVSIRAQIVNLLSDLQRKLGLTYLFIAHDLSVVRHISDRIAVMYAGQIVELTHARLLYERPMHPYTQALLSAVPIPERRVGRRENRRILTGDIPNPAAPPPGCRFHTRCPYRQPRCSVEPPALRDVGLGQRVACHYAEAIRDHSLVPGQIFDDPHHTSTAESSITATH